MKVLNILEIDIQYIQYCITRIFCHTREGKLLLIVTK